MIVRDARPEDNAAIGAIHLSSGIDYRIPDLNSPLFFVRKVAESENVLLGACFLRIAAETYLWLEPGQSPRSKLKTMQALQPAVLANAWRLGIDDVEARIPETIETRFRKRLTQLGWTPNRNGWRPWSRETQ